MRRQRIEDENENEEISTENNSESGVEDLFGEGWEEDYKTDAEEDQYDPDDLASEQEIEDNYSVYERSSEEAPLVIENDSTNDRRMNLFSFLNKHKNEIREMCTNNKESLYVSYLDLEREFPSLIPDLIGDTESFMNMFDEVLEQVVLNLFPNYGYIINHVNVRLKKVPLVENIRSLRNIHLGTLVKVRGVVTRRSSVIPLLSLVTYLCGKCGVTFGPMIHDIDQSKICVACQSRGPHTVCSTDTIYKDMQKITIQEVPGTVPSGRLPRQKEVHLTYDLIDSCKPGEEVEVTGIYKNTFSHILNKKSKFPIFTTIIQAITIDKKIDEESFQYDAAQVKKASKYSNIVELIINSIAPGVYGHRYVKKAIVLALFGGQRKESEGHIIRGDINVLLLGDPGTAKSQFLRYIEKTSPRAVLATGQGASSVGLTASVRRDPMTKEWSLEGGALVLADRGVCLIDEFDKMDDIDRVSIHEAMEQQSISISKAGIVASLNARCSVIAAANAKRGRYNNNLTFQQNVNLSDPIISRFDILCIIRDTVGADDEFMGDFIVKTHMKLLEQGLKEIKGEYDDSETKEEVKPNEIHFFEGLTRDDNGNEVLTQSFLKKYINYARNNCFPKLRNVDKDKISKLYSELRKESMSSGSIPITARHIEGIIRLSEAFAKMKLKEYVDNSDIEAAIETALESFISSQKYSAGKVLRKKFSKYIGVGGEALIYIINSIFNELVISQQNLMEVQISQFEERVRKAGLTIKEEFYNSLSFKNSGYSINGSFIKRNRIAQSI